MPSGVPVSNTITVKTLRHEIGRVIKRVRKGEHFTVLYRSQPAFRIVPLHGGISPGPLEGDSLYRAKAVGRSTDNLSSSGHDRTLYGEGDAR